MRAGISKTHVYRSNASTPCQRSCSICGYVDYAHNWKNGKCTICGLTMEKQRTDYLNLLKDFEKNNIDPAENGKLVGIAVERISQAKNLYAREYALGFFDFIEDREVFKSFPTGSGEYDKALGKALIDVACLAYKDELIPEFYLMGFKGATLLEPEIEVACFGAWKGHAQTVVAGMMNDQNEPVVLLAFRGSELDDNWMTDWINDAHIFGVEDGVHEGFATYARAVYNESLSVKLTGIEGEPTLGQLINMASVGQKVHFILTGHSLGGAMAQVFCSYLVKERGVPIEQITVYTYASPQPFEQRFDVRPFENANIYNVRNPYDPVTSVGAVNGQSIGETIWVLSDQQRSQLKGENPEDIFVLDFSPHWSAVYKELIYNGKYLN